MTTVSPKLISFNAEVQLLGINPYVFIPERHLRRLFRDAGKERGAIPLVLVLGGVTFRQNLVKSHGAWRLYLNMPMRKALGKDVGDKIRVQVAFDPEPKQEPANPLLTRALAKSKPARAAFDALSPSRKKEIQRYLNGLKSEEARVRNVEKVLSWLLDRKSAGAPAYLRAASQ